MERLRAAAGELGLRLDDGQLESFKIYMALLLEWNEKFNLTAITDEEGVIYKHFLDSMTLLLAREIPEGASVVDIGAGAGFPSLPVKIARPDLKITMLDSLSKRVEFLNEVTARLKLKDISAVHCRAEDGARTELRESFDLAAARAVAALPALAEYALPFVKTGGYFVAMKGTSPEDETAAAAPALKVLGGRLEEVRKMTFRGLEHSLVIVKKVGSTPSKYPRKAGKPAKDPIK